MNIQSGILTHKYSQIDPNPNDGTANEGCDPR